MSLTESAIKAMTVPMLKDKLKELGLDTKGLKAQLLQRLLEANSNANTKPNDDHETTNDNKDNTNTDPPKNDKSSKASGNNSKDSMETEKTEETQKSKTLDNINNKNEKADPKEEKAKDKAEDKGKDKEEDKGEPEGMTVEDEEEESLLEKKEKLFYKTTLNDSDDEETKDNKQTQKNNKNQKIQAETENEEDEEEQTGEPSESEEEQDDGSEPPRVLVFRNYTVRNKELSARSKSIGEYNVKEDLDWVEKEIGSLSQEALKAEANTKDNLLRIAPKSVNWDLKRDVLPRMEVLKIATAKALQEIAEGLQKQDDDEEEADN